MKNGYFVISLDYELLWGVHDATTIETYGSCILGVQSMLPKLIEKFKKHNIKSTFAVVGFLFYKSNEEFKKNIIEVIPAYKNSSFSTYNFFNNITKISQNLDNYFYDLESILLLKNNGHEIGTHTHSHYFCLEEGQTALQFEADLLKAIQVAKMYAIDVKSIVFPRNQFNNEYLDICFKHGIKSYRGNEKSWIYKPSQHHNESIIKRIFRLLDSYLPISGYNCYEGKVLQNHNCINIPSSAFLRPYNKRLKIFEKVRLRKIKRAMTFAAKNNKIYHLWWHPHNFGVNQDENLAFLEAILNHYDFLKSIYNFQSITMNKLADKIISNE